MRRSRCLIFFASIYAVTCFSNFFSVKRCVKNRASVYEEMNWDPKSAPKLDFKECYYSVLEVDPTSTAEVIKKAFYKMVFKYHPDK